MKAETDNRGCPSAGSDPPALMMAGRMKPSASISNFRFAVGATAISFGKRENSQKRGEIMTKQEFDKVTLDLLVAWFIEMYRYISEDSEAQKIEPSQKRQLIATAQSLLHDVQDILESEQKAL